MMQPVDARVVALDLLESVLGRKWSLDRALEAHPGLGRMESRDRGFARLLATTVLRRMRSLDGMIDAALTRPDLDLVARDILRLGLTQLRYLGTPAHAAISTSVDLADARAPRLKGMVNAILRRQEGLPFNDDPSINLPGWLWDRWAKTYGEDTAGMIAEFSLREPSLDITVKGEVDAWASRLDAQVMPMATLRRPLEGAVEKLDGYQQGDWWIQDLSASLPVKLMGDLAGKRVIDLCAAPGGKTAQLAAAGAIVTAIDRSPQRLKRLAQNLERLNLTAQQIASDACAWTPDQPADAILLDAPCLATGTIRRHPDIPHLKTEADLRSLVEVQARLLDHAATLVKPDGLLMYCTCSLEPEEGESQVDAFLSRHAAFRRDVIRAEELPGLEMVIDPKGDLRALPHMLGERGGMDGFFVSRLRLG